MKKVFTSSSEVIHLFANQLQEEARCNNVFFRGTKIYSYGHHYLLAEFIDYNTVYINDNGYSATTGKHINEVRYATRHKRQFFKSESDLWTVLNSVRANVQSLKNARKPLKYVENSLYLFDKLNEYLDYTNNTHFKLDVDYIELSTLIDAIKSDAKNSIDALNTFASGRKKLELEAQKKVLKTKLKDFRAYKINSLRINGKDYLRLSKDKQYIETSQGIKITIDEAKRLLKLIENNSIIGETVDNKFIVKAFNKLLVVGCHNIPLTEINRVKKQIV